MIRLLIAVVAIIIAIVTGFYLSILHRAAGVAEQSADRAQDRVDRIQDRADEIQNMVRDYEREFSELNKKWQNELNEFRNTKSGLWVQGILGMDLREKTIAPLITEIYSLWERVEGEEVPKGKADFLNELWFRIRAEGAMFTVSKTIDYEDFLDYWHEAEVYREVYVREKENFSYLFSLVREKLDDILGQADIPPEKRAELRHIKKELSKYGAKSDKIS
ncbi:MAG: hypothetical protein GY862_38920 [Gammaproteobacteria bacterium]|nr:hypothetical protein [Gammaproteobacteria bacterium]